MNNNLKLQIITALDNAGIKATKQQINSLTVDVQKANSQMGGLGGSSKNVDKVFRKLGGNVADFAGAFGKLGGAMGILYGATQAFIGSFKMADKFFQSFAKEGIVSVNSVKDGFKNLGHSIKEFFTGYDAAQARRNEKLKEMYDGIKNGMKTAIESTNKELDKSLLTQQKIAQSINNSTKAYLSQANVLKGLNNAKGDEELIGLEQDKFDNAQLLRDQGNEEGAKQIEKYYDWLITQRKAAIEIDNAENELAKQIQTANASSELLKAKGEEVKRVKDQLKQEENEKEILRNMYLERKRESDEVQREIKRRKAIGAEITLDLKNERDMKLRSTDSAHNLLIQKREFIEKLREKQYTKENELIQLQIQSQADQVKQTELAYRLTNASKRGIYQTDVAGSNYQSWVSQNGNVLGLEFDEQYGKQAYGQLEVSEGLKEVVEQLKTNNETLKELLGIKQ